MIEQIQTGSSRIPGFALRGKVCDEDSLLFVPAFEYAPAHESELSLFARIADFHGWDLPAAWDDLKIGEKHCADFNRIAKVGEREWEKWPVKSGKPFTRVKIRYLDASKTEAAWAWLREATEEK